MEAWGGDSTGVYGYSLCQGSKEAELLLAFGSPFEVNLPYCKLGCYSVIINVYVIFHVNLEYMYIHVLSCSMNLLFRPTDIHVGRLMFYHVFFFLLLRRLISQVG